MKDTIIAVLLGLILIGYYGCGKDDKETSNKEPTSEEIQTVKLLIAKGEPIPTPDSVKLEWLFEKGKTIK
ncbi:MAG: hypothetical protein HY762_04170, partial [Planctomycetes bacterium]|nr:hypothetical protein [Planctomycetota bacterium]